MRPEPDRFFAHHEIAAAVSEMMGLILPARVAESLLKRLARKRQVVCDQCKYRLADGVVDGLPNLASKKSAFMRDQEALIDKLVALTHDLAHIVREHPVRHRCIQHNIDAVRQKPFFGDPPPDPGGGGGGGGGATTLGPGE